jgi:hypothetical protein
MSLEMARRTSRKDHPLDCLVLLVYTYFGPYFPLGLGHSGFSLSRIAENIFLTNEGVFGSLTSIFASYILIFVIMGSFMEVSGCGKVFETTSNGFASTGDGFSIAFQSGIPLEDMEFVQFFPFALAEPGQPSYHIGEALAEEGKIIMQYFYAHNYRGFTRAVIPISQVTFLVGENSTGKSSRQ